MAAGEFRAAPLERAAARVEDAVSQVITVMSWMARRDAARTAKLVLVEEVDAPPPDMFPVLQTIFAVLLDIPATVIAPTTLNAASPPPTLTLRLQLQLRLRLRPPAALYQPTHPMATAATIIQTRTTVVRTVPVKTSPVLPVPSPSRPSQGPVQTLFRTLLDPPRPIFRAVAAWV